MELFLFPKVDRKIIKVKKLWKPLHIPLDIKVKDDGKLQRLVQGSIELPLDVAPQLEKFRLFILLLCLVQIELKM